RRPARPRRDRRGRALPGDGDPGRHAGRRRRARACRPAGPTALGARTHDRDRRDRAPPRRHLRPAPGSRLAGPRGPRRRDAGSPRRRIAMGRRNRPLPALAAFLFLPAWIGAQDPPLRWSEVQSRIADPKTDSRARIELLERFIDEREDDSSKDALAARLALGGELLARFDV